MKLNDVVNAPNVLIIAESGRGKTHAIATFCQLAPTVVLTSDKRGLDTLKTLQRDKFKNIDPEIEVANNWTDPWALYDRLKTLSATHRILCLDDLGALQGVVAHKIQANSRGPAEERMRSDQREQMVRSQLMSGGRRLQMSQWGELDIALNSFLTEVIGSEDSPGLPYRVIVVTVLEDVRDHPRTGQSQVYPNLQGGIRDDLMARFSLVVNLFMQEAEDGRVQYVASCRPHPRLPNKTRYGEPRTWIDPTAAKFMAHINGKEGEADKETQAEKKIGSGQLTEQRR